MERPADVKDAMEWLTKYTTYPTISRYIRHLEELINLWGLPSGFEAKLTELRLALAERDKQAKKDAEEITALRAAIPAEPEDFGHHMSVMAEKLRRAELEIKGLEFRLNVAYSATTNAATDDIRRVCEKNAEAQKTAEKFRDQRDAAIEDRNEALSRLQEALTANRALEGQVMRLKDELSLASKSEQFRQREILSTRVAQLDAMVEAVRRAVE